MDFVLDIFTKKELMIMGIVIGGLVLIVLVLTLIDLISKKRKENNELDDLFSEFDRFDFEPIKKTKKPEVVEPISLESIETQKKDSLDTINLIEEVKVESENVLTETKIDSNIKENYVEPLIMDVDENIKYVSEVDLKTNAQEELLRITEELQNPVSLEDTLYNLEAMEEENAIISYQELLEATSELNVVQADSGDEPISIKEILNMYENDDVSSKTLVENEMSKTTINDAYKGDFTSSPYLSPILGVEIGVDLEKSPNMSLAEIQLENTANLEKLDKEMRKTNEFLSILNDLKKNLD